MGDWSQGIPYTRDVVDKPGCEFGAYTYGVPNIYGDAGSLRVGKFCSIAPNVHFFLATNHRADWVTTYPFPALSRIGDEWQEARDIPGVPLSKGGIIVGSDVWIGFGTIVLPGAVIGDGAVVGAGSIVTGEVPPYSVVGGSPARFIRARFSEPQIAELLEIRWWDWPIDRIRDAMRLLNSAELDTFLAYARRTPSR